MEPRITRIIRIKIPFSLLIRAIGADFCEARRKDHGGLYVAPYTAFHCFTHSGRRQREHSEIDAQRKLIHASKHRAPANIPGAATDKMNRTGKLIVV